MGHDYSFDADLALGFEAALFGVAAAFIADFETAGAAFGVAAGLALLEPFRGVASVSAAAGAETFGGAGASSLLVTGADFFAEAATFLAGDSTFLAEAATGGP